MQLSPVAERLLLPDARSLAFAGKGVLAMAMALYVAMYFQLDRPYWAMVSAVFLQIRPESGMVIEKGLCQVLGTLAGGAFGILVLSWLTPYPELAIACLTVWLGMNAAASAMVRRSNFIYAFAMAGMTACLIVMLVMASPATASSAKIFQVAQARVIELIVGLVCATIVSLVFWPVKVNTILKAHGRNVINNTLDYLALELSQDSSHQQRHNHIDSLLEILNTLNDDSSAVVFEGANGRGRSRAASLLCNKVMSLMALIQIFGRLQRNHPEQLTPLVREAIGLMQSCFTQLASSRDYDTSYQMVVNLRRQQQSMRQQPGPDSPALEIRLLKIATELSAELLLVLRAWQALDKPDSTLLRAPGLIPHRDPLTIATRGLRTGLVFLIGATLWIQTGSSALIMMMLLPVVFSVMMARLPLPLVSIVLKRLMVGAVFAVLLAIFYALNLLASSTGDFEILILILAPPYFAGLLLLANRPTLPYGLGLCIPFTILVRPGTDMSMPFSIDYTLSSGLAIIAGVGLVYWLFQLITGPGTRLMQNHLIHNTSQDLKNMLNQSAPEAWFNARMGDRLLRIASYDKSTSPGLRNITDLGLSGLNLGHVSMRLQRLVTSSTGKTMYPVLRRWQSALADAYQLSYQGRESDSFRAVCSEILQEAERQNMPEDIRLMITGMFERLNLTFSRSADMMKEASGKS